MIDKRKSRISLVTLIFCLCVGSLVILPLIQINPSTQKFSTMDVSNLFEHTEFDDDLFAVSIVGVTAAEPSFPKFTLADLGYLSAPLSLVSPPPKQS